MNWLVIPHTGKVNVRGESNFILFEDMARSFIEAGDYVYFCVPQWAKDEDLLLPRDKCKYIKLDITGAYYVDMLLWGHTLAKDLNRKIGSVNIDCVITSKPFLVPYLAVGLSDISRGDVPVMYFEPGVDDKFERLRRSEQQEQTPWFAVCSAYVTGYTTFLTQAELDSATKYVRQFFTPSLVDEFYRERSMVLPVGVPIELLDKYKDKPKGKFKLFFGARVNDVKRADKIADLFTKFYSSGRDVDITICTSTPDMLAKRYIGKQTLHENKNIQLFTDMNREKYLEQASSAHVFVAMSKREGFPVGFWEQMYLGIIGVFINEKWVRAQIPSDYPFIFNTYEEAYAMLSWIMDNYEEAKAKVQHLRDRVRDFNKTRIYAETRERGMFLSNKKDQWRMTTGIVDLINQALPEMGDEFSLLELLTKLNEKGEIFVISNKARGRTYRYPSDYDIYRYMQTIGFDYRIEFGEGFEDKLIFVRRKDAEF